MLFSFFQVFEDTRIPFFPKGPTYDARKKVPGQVDERLGGEGGSPEVEVDEDAGGIVIRGFEDKRNPIPNVGGELAFV